MARAVVVGAGGRMGRRIIHTILQTSGIGLAGAVERDGHPAVGKDAGDLAGEGSVGVVVGSDLSRVVDKAEGGRMKAARRLPTVVRNVLRLPRTLDPSTPWTLFSITGRKVLDLQPGENDVRGVAPGVYFVQEEGPRSQGSQGSSVRKVVISK